METYVIADFEDHAREPILRRMKDGSLICLFLKGGEGEPDNDNFVAISRSYDDGATWSKPEVLFNQIHRGTWCPELYVDDNLAIAFVHTYNKPYHYRELLTYFSKSYDNGKTWSEPKTVPGHINGCSVRQGFKLSNGDTLFPVYWQECVCNFNIQGEYDYSKPMRYRCGVAIVPKDETYFQRFGYIANDDLELWEPNAVEVEEGHIIMYIRTNTGHMYYSESFDYGRSWSEAKSSGIFCSDSKITCLKVNGKVLMIHNAVKEGRTHLEIAKSDDGLDFEHIRYVEEKEERIFYPHAFVDDEKKMLYIAYENAKTHKLAKFSYDELGI